MKVIAEVLPDSKIRIHKDTVIVIHPDKKPLIIKNGAVIREGLNG